jgi:alcohol dehydrogenase
MDNFRFYCPARIIFGKGTENEVGDVTARIGKTVLLLYGAQSIKSSGLHGLVTDSLLRAGASVVDLGGVRGNPKLAFIRDGIRLARERKIDVILAVGGGSVIDTAKAIAAGVPYAGDVWDFFVGKAKPSTALPVGVVLTKPAAGSEASNGTVVVNQEAGLKRNLNYEGLIPRFAIMNPEFSFTLSPYQTATGVSDIMSHVIERYFTQTRNVDFTDRLCEATLKTLLVNGPIAVREPTNYAARAEIMWAGTIAHNDLLGTGRLADWASHKIEHELTAINDGDHGAGIAVLQPAWMRFVYRQGLQRFVQFAVRVMGVEQSFDEPERTALEGIRRLSEFHRSIGLPTTLREIGIQESHFPRIVAQCALFDATTVGHFARITRDDIGKILEIAK